VLGPFLLPPSQKLNFLFFKLLLLHPECFLLFKQARVSLQETVANSFQHLLPLFLHFFQCLFGLRV
jgi:hypothetical protein